MPANQQTYDEPDYRCVSAAAALDGMSIRDWIKLQAIRAARARLREQQLSTTAEDEPKTEKE